ncbi:hypothetical protein, partial [Bacteroides intestinalis]|uniref:hypothetical protein n=1 Tax=Bacteroides intestinalis TaxID=329854 RepID=UPI0022DEBD17
KGAESLGFRGQLTLDFPCTKRELQCNYVFNGGPEKTFTNRYSNSSPRYSVRTTMLSLFVIRNFSGFH